MSHSTNKGLAAAFGFLVVLGILGGAWTLGRHSREDASSPGNIISTGREPGGLNQPCAGDGTEVNLDKANSDLPFHVLVPNNELANETNMTSVWECPGQAVQMLFSSGITITIGMNTIEDPETAWRSLAEQDPTNTSVAEVRGQPAALIDPAKDPSGSSDGSVSVVDDGLLIAVVGNGKLSLDALVAVTESMK